MTETGKIKVFTGDGKGKTTAALGLAWRAIGRGFKVFMVQFLKSPDSSGEHFAAAMYPNLVIKPMGRKGFITSSGPDPRDKAMAEAALEEARSALTGGVFDLVVLDEINVAIHFGLIDVEDLMAFMETKPEGVELVLTGRYAHPKIIDLADNALEMKSIKHHFDEGVPARKGIEY